MSYQWITRKKPTGPAGETGPAGAIGPAGSGPTPITLSNTTTLDVYIENVDFNVFRTYNITLNGARTTFFINSSRTNITDGAFIKIMNYYGSNVKFTFNGGSSYTALAFGDEIKIIYHKVSNQFRISKVTTGITNA
jgi:hypothetical protein